MTGRRPARSPVAWGVGLAVAVMGAVVLLVHVAVVGLESSQPPHSALPELPSGVHGER